MAQAAPWSYVVASFPPFPSVGLWQCGLLKIPEPRPWGWGRGAWRHKVKILKEGPDWPRLNHVSVREPINPV